MAASALSASIALAFATIERPQAVQRLVRSVRKYFPTIPIYVADQSRQVDAMRAFYARYDVTLVRMPYDIGVTASRNALVREIDEEFFILCDDDFVFDCDTSFEDAVRILRAVPGIGVVGGRLMDFDGEKEWLRNWEIYLQYDKIQKILFSIPIYNIAPKARIAAGVIYYICDAVLNFSVLRRSIFDNGVAWDEQFKSNGEHEDFFLNMKLNTTFKVAYLPTMVAYHHHPEIYQTYINRLRERNDGWRLFFEKWGIDQHVEFGLGVRTRDDFDRIINEEDTRARFFLNPDLCLRHDTAGPERILLNDSDVPGVAGVFDDTGRSTRSGRGKGRLLVNISSSAIVPVRDGPSSANGAPCGEGARDSRQIAECYRLETVNDGRAISATEVPLYFRYDPIIRNDADFFLWYLCGSAQGAERQKGDRLAVTIRWSTSNGTCLLWRSRRRYLDLEDDGYWRPLFVDVPVMPRESRWLRFDVVTDGGTAALPVCTGFLFGRIVGGTSSRLPATPDRDVLALGRLPNDGSEPMENGLPLAELGRNCRWRSVTVESEPGVPGMSRLRIDAQDGFEVLYFTDWTSLGRRLISARLPAGSLQAPAALALPGDGWRSGEARVYGFGRLVGFVALAP